MKSFKSYVDKKQRSTVKQLKIIKSLLEKNGLKVSDFTENVSVDGDPYIFVYNTSGTRYFDGIRIYNIGGKFAYRVQKEEATSLLLKLSKKNFPEIRKSFDTEYIRCPFNIPWYCLKTTYQAKNNIPEHRKENYKYSCLIP